MDPPQKALLWFAIPATDNLAGPTVPSTIDVFLCVNLHTDEFAAAEGPALSRGDRMFMGPVRALLGGREASPVMEQEPRETDNLCCRSLYR